MKNHHYSICVVSCFFGELPWYFRYFIHSCGHNKSIDFKIFTDQDLSFDYSKNVQIIKTDLDEFRLLSSRMIGFSVAVDAPYKICDLKPAFGIIFSDFLKGYDYWAHSDVDIIFGNIRGFMSKAILNKYEYISVRHDYTTGCFALYKNSEKINNLFRRSKDYKKVFTSPEHFCFDECNFMQNELANGYSIFDTPSNIESFTHIVQKATIDQYISSHFDFIIIEGTPGKLKFNNGTLTYKSEYEVMLYHLYLFKIKSKCNKAHRTIPSKYSISTTQIY